MNPISKTIIILLLFLLASCAAPVPPGVISPTSEERARGQAAKTISLFRVVYHPDGPLYVGDQVSIEVIGPSSFTSHNQKISVSLGSKELGEADFSPFGIGGRQQATFYWIWDTRGLESGSYTLTFSIAPAGLKWDRQVSLNPVTDVPLPEPGAHWETAESVCCTIHYVSGTESERDIEKLKSMADAQAAEVTKRMGTEFDEKIPLTFLPRVLGQGGFASNGIYVSYLDRNYAGSTAQQVTHHEMVHWLDRQLGGKARISMLQEGLAVYYSGGHFKPEPILVRAEALIQMERYIPLRQLTDSFYSSQHEIGYLEAGALVGYLVETYGTEKFNIFFRNLQHVDGPDSAVLDAGLKTHFGISFDQLERDFIDYLHKQTVSESDLTDVRLTVSFYDTVRRYQQLLDPSAHFMTAWLPSGDDVRSRGIVADYLRHPVTSVERQIENLLVEGDASLRAKDYQNAELRIYLVNTLLDVIERNQK
jgi:hypothetical protein